MLILMRDIEETEDQLDQEFDKLPLDFWEKKQRELVTSVVDYNLKTLSDLVTSNIIDLSPKYQRRFRWDQNRQSKLVESFLMNVPVPPIFLNEDDYGAYSVIDGKQRLTAITEFFRGRLKLQSLDVFSDINGMSIDDLPKGLRNVLETRPTIRAVIILRQSDSDVKFEVFQRLNTGGVKLNAQEVRNSAYPGSLNDAILELAEHSQFHQLLNIRNKAKSAIYQEMRDAEFVLRFFTFKDNWSDFKGSMKRNMDQFMYNNRHLRPKKISEIKSDFLNTVAVVDASFGVHAFKRWDISRSQWRKPILAALYDAQMFAASNFKPEQFEGKQKLVEKAQIKLFHDEEFQRAITAATNNLSNFKKRVELTFQMLTKIAED